MASNSITRAKDYKNIFQQTHKIQKARVHSIIDLHFLKQGKLLTNTFLEQEYP